jgi:Mrp family chromosome partitioning ATPase
MECVEQRNGECVAANEEKDFMTFEQYWLILIKRWRLVLLCFLIVGLGALIGSKLMKPLYQSSALIQVVFSSTTSQANYDNLLAGNQLVQTESTLAVSDPVLSEVATHYPDVTKSLLAGEVSSSPKTSTQLFEIDVVDPSPNRAASLANDIAATLIKQQLQAIQQNNAQAQQQIQQNLDQTSQQLNDTTAKIAALRAKGGDQGQVAPLQIQLNGLQQRYTQWQNALAQLELAQAQNGNPLRVAQSAQPASSPVRPNIRLNTGGGLLAGLLLGMLLAVLFERLDTRVRTTEALAQLLEWPVLATILRASSANREDVINPTGHNVNAEPFRILRTNIGFAALDKPLHSMLVTSALPRDGKSVIAANLAIFMAKTGKNTLLVDADLRRPTQHALFGMSTERLGLSNAVLAFGTQTSPHASSYPQFFSPASSNHPSGMPSANGLSLEPFVHSVGMPNLWVMPTGPLPPNPSELLDSKAMQRFLTVIEHCGVDVVIFDTPPLLGLSDASILASKVDGALVVVDITRAQKGKLKQMKSVLAQTGANVLGCVINKQRGNRHDTAYTYYYASADEQEEERKQAKNGHNAPVPATPSSSWSQSHVDKGMRSN